MTALRFALLLLAVLYPFAMALGGFLGIEPLDWPAVFRSLAASWSMALVLYWLCRFFIPDRDARASWLAVVLLFCGAYALLLNVVGALGIKAAPAQPLVALAFLAAVGAFATLATSPWKQKRRDLVPLALVAASLIGVNTYQGVARMWDNPVSRGQQASAEITGAPARSPASPSAPARDIYYIVVDGLGREDVLRRDYGLDIGDFASSLRNQGFYVPDRARSNYAHTLLSFSSFLNLGYINAMTDAVGRETPSWLPLVDLIQKNALMRLAKEAGYQITAIGSDYGPTKRFEQADLCVCTQRGLDMFEQVVLGQTPLAALPIDRWTYGSHRLKVLDAFAELERPAAGGSRRFVLAHILSPHPPFTFAADGSFRRPDLPFMFNEGSDFLGTREEYVHGYREQATFIIRRLNEAVQSILSRPGPKPVIILHSDHGPGSMLQLNDLSRTNLPERMNIFAAYYFPDGQPDLYPSMTPVNGARALANGYLGTRLPRLPDDAWFSPAMRPFDMTLVPAEPAAAAAGSGRE